MLLTWGMEMKFKVDVLHATSFPAGSVVDGVVLAERSFVGTGRHEIAADKSLMDQLEASGYLEILSIDGATAVWAACCGGH